MAMTTVARLVDNTTRQTRSRPSIHECRHHRLRSSNQVMTVRRLMALLVMQRRASREAREAEAEMVAAVEIGEGEEEGVEVDDEDRDEVLCELQLVAGCLRGG